MADTVIKRQGLKNRIHQVGIELEGGWDAQPKGVRIDRDGSVRFPSFRVDGITPLLDAMAPPAGLEKLKFVGEIPSPPLDLSEVEGWLKKCYPQHVNESCGLHTHMSFRFKINYMRLMTPTYTPFIVKGLLGWAEEQRLAKDHPIWGRLKNPNHDHCAHTYLGDNQAQITRKDFHSRGKAHSRYTAVNYCWAQHKTVEVRVLPMFETVEQATLAVNEVYRLTNQFLSKVRQKEIRAEARVALSPPVDGYYRIRV